MLPGSAAVQYEEYKLLVLVRTRQYGSVHELGAALGTARRCAP